MGADGDGRGAAGQDSPADAGHRGCGGRLSASTVSRILNDAPTRVPIARETRERVLEEARKLGYRPNPLARGLRGAPTMLLGALLDMDEPPTAVLATTDLVASACSTWPTAGGGRFQTSCRWSGYDDILIAAHTVPALTTLRMPIAEIVAEGVQTAIELARDPTEPRAPRLRPFEPTLIVRQSTAPPRADSESPELSPGVALG